MCLVVYHSSTRRVQVGRDWLSQWRRLGGVYGGAALLFEHESCLAGKWDWERAEKAQAMARLFLSIGVGGLAGECASRVSRMIETRLGVCESQG